jgi:cellulose biosynthesis protein BcsQ
MRGGTALAAIGERVPVIDLDPQGNASAGLGSKYARSQMFHVQLRGNFITTICD